MRLRQTFVGIVIVVCATFFGSATFALQGANLVERLAGVDGAGHLIAYDWSPVHDWEAEDITAKLGVRATNDLTSWQVRNGPYMVQHLAASALDGDLNVFFWSPQGDWGSVDVTQKAGFKVRGALTSWQTPNGPFNVEHVAGTSPDGDLIVFYWSPQHDWQAVNVSQKTGAKVSWVSTSWQTPNGPYNVEHLAAAAPNGDLLVFYWSPQHDWQVVNVSQKTGVKVATPATSWQTPNGPYNVEHLAAAAPNGELTVFYWSPQHDWQAVNVSQKTGVKVSGAATSWQTPNGPYNVEHLAAVDTAGSLQVFYWSPQHDWQSVDISQKTGVKIIGQPTSWQTSNGPYNIEHLAAKSASGHTEVFFWSPQHDWQAVDVSALSGSLIAGTPVSWQTHDLPRTVAVVTQHNDNARTGVQASETKLTPASVRTFGMRLLYPPLTVDAISDAQPLYVRSVAFPQGSANALFTVTANNTAYAFDADRGGAPLWSTHLAGSSADLARPYDLPPTPVIDAQNGVLYTLIAYSNIAPDLPAGNNRQQALTTLLQTFRVAYELVAVDISTGKILRRMPISATSRSANGPLTTFDARLQQSHPALLLDHGSIYIAFGSSPGWEFFGGYHGWVMRYDAKTLSAQGTFCTSCNVNPADDEDGGIWQGGGGLAADSAGNIYFLVANGPSDAANQAYGDGFVRLTPKRGLLTLTGYAPAPNAALMNAHDLDLGSGGPVLLPGTAILAGGGKTGTIYTIDTNTMTAAGNGPFLDSFQAYTNTYHPDWDYGCPTPLPVGCQDYMAGAHLHSSPIYWHGRIYDPSEKDHMKAMSIDAATGRLGRTPLVGPIRATATLMPGGLSALSAFGDNLSTGVIWSTLPSADPNNPDNLKSLVIAYDAANLNVLWESWLPQAAPVMSHRGGPMIADGKLVVATWSNALLVYGLGNTPVATQLTLIQPVEQSMKMMKIMDRDRFNLTKERLETLHVKH